MIRKYIEIIGGVAVVIAIGIFLVWFTGRDNQDQQATHSIQENVQSAVEASRMQASRVKRGTYIIDRQNFENNIRTGLATTSGGGLSTLKDKNVKFAYLIDSSATDLNDKVTNNKGEKKTQDLTNPSSQYIAIKGVRVLIDKNNDGIFTGKQDIVATLAVDARDSGGEQ